MHFLGYENDLYIICEFIPGAFQGDMVVGTNYADQQGRDHGNSVLIVVSHTRSWIYTGKCRDYYDLLWHRVANWVLGWRKINRYFRVLQGDAYKSSPHRLTFFLDTTTHIIHRGMYWSSYTYVSSRCL